MQGLFNIQQSFFTSLFSRGPFASNVVTVCSRRVVTSSRCAIHHGKGVTFKIHGERSTGYGHNIHCFRTPQGPASCKYYQTSNCLKTSKSGKSSGSSCRIIRSMKGKIVFRVNHQHLPKIIMEESADKPSVAFRNSINKVFGCKPSKKHKLNKCHLAYSKQPVKTSSSPEFKEVPAPSFNRGKQNSIKGSPTANVVKKSQSAETRKFVEHAKDGAKNNETVFRTNSKKTLIETSTKEANGGENLSVRANDKNHLHMNRCADSKSETVLSNKKTLKPRIKPLVFSSSEMLFSSADPLNKSGTDTMRKPENSFDGSKQCIGDKIKCEMQKESSAENSRIEPLEDRFDSTVKLFMNKRSHQVRKESELPEAVEGIKNLSTDVEMLHFEPIGQTPVVQLSKPGKISGHNLAHTEIQFRKVDDDVGRLHGTNQGLGEVLPADQDALGSPLKSTDKPIEWNNVTKTSPPNVHTLKKSDNVTLHKHMDLKRQMKEERVEFETTVMEQGGKKITRMTPKIRDSTLQRSSSNRALALKKTKSYLNNFDRNSKKKTSSNNRRNTEIEASTQEKPDRVTDTTVIPEDGKRISPINVDPFVPKVNLRSNRRNVNELVIPADGRVIRDGDSDRSDLESDRSGSLLGKENFKKPANIVETCIDAKYHVDNGQAGGQLREPRQTGNDLSMVSTANSLGANQRVGNVQQYKVTAMEVNKESEYAKSSPKMFVSKQDVASPHINNNVADRIVSRTPLIDKESVHRQTGFSQVTQISSESSVHKQNETSNKNSWRYSLPSSNNKTNEPGKILDEKQGLHSSFADSFVTAHTVISNVRDGNLEWKRKVTKMKVVPQNGLESSEVGSSVTSHILNQGVQSTARPTITSDMSETAVVLKSRLAQTSPLSVTSELSQERSNNAATSHSYKPQVSTVADVRLMPADAPNVNDQASGMRGSRIHSMPSSPASLSFSSLMNSGTSTSGGSSSNCSCEMLKASFPPICNTCENKALTGGNQRSGLNSSCDMQKASFPPPCNTCPNKALTAGNQGSCLNSSCDVQKASFPPPCNTCHNKPTTAGNQGSCLNSSCEMPKASFPPPCITCQIKPLIAGNPGSCLNSSCDMQKASFPPPCNTCQIKPTTARNQGSCLNSSCDTQKASFPPPCNTCQIKPTTARNQGSCLNSSCDTQKASFPPPCITCQIKPLMAGNPGSCLDSSCDTQKTSFPPPCNTCQIKPLTAGNQGSCLNSSCDMPKASFPPPCNTCHNNSTTAGNQGRCSADGCNTNSVFRPPCGECATPRENNQPECLSCPTCKPQFPPPCPSNPCPSTACRPKNSCYDPCKLVTKSKTHTIIDIDNLPRPPTPIRIDCLPKSKPCFPPRCPKQCKTNSSAWCKQMLDIKNEISFAGWRAYMNYMYWSMKCLVTGIIKRFLAVLTTQIMQLSDCKTATSNQKPCPLRGGCNVKQSSLAAHQRAAQVGMSKFNRTHKHVHSVLQHKGTSKTRARNKRVVKSVKHPVHDDRSKRAVVAEEQKRKSTGVKANPALAYSEVLNIVFSQKK